MLRGGNNIVRAIGVLERKGESKMLFDDTIFIPLTAMQQMVAKPRTSSGEYIVSSIALTVSDEGKASYVVDEITSLLRSRHQLGPGVDDDFAINSMEEIAGTLTETTRTVTNLLFAIAAISRHFIAGRRYRRDEHYASVGTGENQRDRHP
jgi:putative ABC transport system permease protein